MKITLFMSLIITTGLLHSMNNNNNNNNNNNDNNDNINFADPAVKSIIENFISEGVITNIQNSNTVVFENNGQSNNQYKINEQIAKSFFTICKRKRIPIFYTIILRHFEKHINNHNLQEKLHLNRNNDIFEARCLKIFIKRNYPFFYDTKQYYFAPKVMLL